MAGTSHACIPAKWSWAWACGFVGVVTCLQTPINHHYHLPRWVVLKKKKPSAMGAGAWPRCSHPHRAHCARARRGALQVAATMKNARHPDVVCAKNIIQDKRLPRPGQFFELEMTVRDCELDKYGVVNNAIYARYIETARQEMLASLGVLHGLHRAYRPCLGGLRAQRQVLRTTEGTVLRRVA